MATTVILDATSTGIADIVATARAADVLLVDPAAAIPVAPLPAILLPPVEPPKPSKRSKRGQRRARGAQGWRR